MVLVAETPVAARAKEINCMNGFIVNSPVEMNDVLEDTYSPRAREKGTFELYIVSCLSNIR